MHNIRTAYRNFFNNRFYNRVLVTEPRLIAAYPVDNVFIRDDRGNLITQSGRPIDMLSWPSWAWPYITYEVVKPTFTGITISSIHVWDRNIDNPGFFTRIDDVLSQINEVIPVGRGAMVNLGCDGVVWFEQSNPFIQYMGDPGTQESVRAISSDIVRGIARIIVRNYVQ